MLKTRSVCLLIVLSAASYCYGTPIVAIVNDPNDTHSLSEVIAAGGIRVADKLFTEWRVTTTTQNNGLAPNASGISVAGVLVGGEYGLRFNGPWSAGPNDLADTTIGYKVTADAPWLMRDNTLYITAFGAANGGLASISEQVYDGDPTKNFLTPIANKYVWYISPTNYDNIDHQAFKEDGNDVALASIWIVKDVVVNGGALFNGSGHVSEFYQTFSQIPEPGTLLLVAAGGAFAVLRRKR